MLLSHGSRRSTRRSTYVSMPPLVSLPVSHWTCGADPAVYPHSMSSESIYPVSRVNNKAGRSIGEASGYPDFDICARPRDILRLWSLTR